MMPAAVIKTPALKRFWARARASALFYGAMATAVRIGSNLLLLPLLLQILSPPELAVWYIFVALGALANLADFGFGAAVTRVYSFLWAGADDFQTEGLGSPPQDQTPNYSKIQEFHAAVRVVYLRVALVGIGLLVVIGTLCLLRPMRAIANPTGGWFCWAAFIVSTGYGLGTNYWVLACQGINRVRELQFTQLVSGLAYVAAAAIFLVAGWGLFAMVVAIALRSLMSREMCRRVYVRAVPQVSQAAQQALNSMIQRIWPNACKFGILSLGGYLTQQSQVLVCSHFFGPETTASYGLTNQLATFIAGFSTLWLAVKWPEITMLRTQGRLQEMGILFARRLAATILSFAVIAVLLIATGNTLLEWKGTQTRMLPTAFVAVFMLNYLQQLFYGQFGMLTFTENVVPFVKLSIFTGIGSVVLGAFLAWWAGLWGLIAAPLIATASTCLWYVTWRGFQRQPLTVREFARAGLLGHV
ncbi:MAG TPA: hypothetical protein VJ063_08190 [Verrucomicrobiae bacterium]|nr:hypothetical protein [Verrucomicrobiae bacterium]